MNMKIITAYMLALAATVFTAPVAAADVSSLQGSGTEDSPFLIKTPEELTFFAEQVNNSNVYENQFVALGADINMNGVAFNVIGKTEATAFAGTFDGKGHAISNLSISDITDNVGLFGITAATSVIQNLKLNEIKISAVDITNSSFPGAANVGAVAGCSQGVIDKCVVTTTKGIEGKDCVGGIAGSGNIVTNCVSQCEGQYNGVFSTTGSAGGIVAFLTGKAEGNRNSSDVGLYSGTATSGVGGIVGYAAQSAEICENLNEGSIGDWSSNNSPSGGIVGYSAGAYIHNNVNKSNVKGTVATGGIAGYANGGKIELCENAGGLTSITNNGGGIVGITDGAVQITDVVNYGYIQIYNSTRRTLGPNAGGVIGKVNSGSPAITNAVNSGEIFGTDCLGGIIGLGGGTLNGVVNTGSISSYGASGGEGEAVGGLVGKANVATTIRNAYSTGVLSTASAKVSNLVANIDAGVDVTAEDSYFTTDFGSPADTMIGTAITIAQLAAKGSTGNSAPGDGKIRASGNDVFDFGDRYTLPMVKSLKDVDAVRAEAAAVIIVDGDYSNSTGNLLRISGLENIEWRAEVDGNKAGYITFNPQKNAAYVNLPSTDEVEIIATSGEYEKIWDVKLNVLNGIVDVKDLGVKKIAGVKYYNAAGKECDTAFEGVNIVVTRYTDGSTRTVKVVK